MPQFSYTIKLFLFAGPETQPAASKSAEIVTIPFANLCKELQHRQAVLRERMADDMRRERD